MKFFTLSILKSCKHTVLLPLLVLAGCISEPPFPEATEVDAHSTALSKEAQASRQGSVVTEQCGASVGKLPDDKSCVVEVTKQSCDTIKGREDKITDADIASAKAVFSFEISQRNEPDEWSVVEVPFSKEWGYVYDPPRMGKEREAKIHSSFSKNRFSMYWGGDSLYLIKDEKGRDIFKDYLQGTMHEIACLDIDADDTQDFIFEISTCVTVGGNIEWMHGYEILLKEGGKLTKLKNYIDFYDSAAKTIKRGVMTWYSHSKFCAIFEGEELDVIASEKKYGPPDWSYPFSYIAYKNSRRIREIWGHRNGVMVRLSRELLPMPEVKNDEPEQANIAEIKIPEIEPFWEKDAVGKNETGEAQSPSAKEPVVKNDVREEFIAWLNDESYDNSILEGAALAVKGDFGGIEWLTSNPGELFIYGRGSDITGSSIWQGKPEYLNGIGLSEHLKTSPESETTVNGLMYVNSTTRQTRWIPLGRYFNSIFLKWSRKVHVTVEGEWEFCFLTDERYDGAKAGYMIVRIDKQFNVIRYDLPSDHKCKEQWIEDIANQPRSYCGSSIFDYYVRNEQLNESMMVNWKGKIFHVKSYVPSDPPWWRKFSILDEKENVLSEKESSAVFIPGVFIFPRSWKSVVKVYYQTIDPRNVISYGSHGPAFQTKMKSLQWQMMGEDFNVAIINGDQLVIRGEDDKAIYPCYYFYDLPKIIKRVSERTAPGEIPVMVRGQKKFTPRDDKK